MNWKAITLLSLFGGAMGIASLFGLTQGIEWLLWLIIALWCGFVLAKRLEGKHFVNGLFVGLLASVLNAAFQTVFFETYLANNIQSAEKFGEIPGGVDARIFVLIASLVIGILYGAIIGLFTLAGKKFIPMISGAKSES